MHCRVLIHSYVIVWLYVFSCTVHLCLEIGSVGVKLCRLFPHSLLSLPLQCFCPTSFLLNSTLNCNMKQLRYRGETGSPSLRSKAWMEWWCFGSCHNKWRHNLLPRKHCLLLIKGANYPLHEPSQHCNSGNTNQDVFWTRSEDVNRVMEVLHGKVGHLVPRAGGDFFLFFFSSEFKEL